ncbi:MAG: hypothetical protein Unbinned7913contig1002_16 [Prokaryotic dsDNA virus sp.]|nr:MAG: hypothetical protein Unbinned7913contig1002_16 [Prokaryotic dsDNA virus sp.]
MERIPPAVAVLVGKSVHVSAENNLKNKCRNEGALLSLDVVQDLARDTLNKEWSGGGVSLDPEEKSKGVKVVKGEAVDKAVSLSKLHGEELAPVINPVSEDHVEKKFVIEVPGQEYNLAGTLDVEEKDAIRDLKTAKKTPNDSVAHSSDQLSMYALSMFAETGLLPKKLALDYLVNLKTPKIKTLETTRTKADLQIFLRRIEVSIRLIKSGIFIPCNSDNWCCDVRYCGYATTCPYFKK